jgi:phospholipid/cholesterol/gamma-HCH transport system substrate-binding protein
VVSVKWIEVWVGLLMVAGIAALLVLAFRVSGLTAYAGRSHYKVVAEFENIGDLKPRAPVTIAGVRIGEVATVILNPKTYKAQVYMHINGNDTIPSDSSASIVTAGLLGSNYVALTPGFDDLFLKDGSIIAETHPAIQLETLIGQLMFNMKKDTATAAEKM